MSGPHMQAVRQTCIELVESVDTVIRRSEEASVNDPTSFDEAVVSAMKKMASVPVIHRLRGRVREARDVEILAAMTFMSELADRESGNDIIMALIAASIEAGKPEIAQKLRQVQGQMMREAEQAKSN